MIYAMYVYDHDLWWCFVFKLTVITCSMSVSVRDLKETKILMDDKQSCKTFLQPVDRMSLATKCQFFNVCTNPC